MNKLKKNYIMIPIVICILSLIAMTFINLKSSNLSFKSYKEFLKDAHNDQLLTVYMVPSSKITVVMKDGTKYTTDNPNSLTLKEELLSKGIEVKENSSTTFMQTGISAVLTLSVLTIVFMSLSKAKSSKGVTAMDAVDASTLVKDKFNFNSLAGNEEAKESVKDIVDYLKNPDKYKKYGARVPKGIILYGSPGTGKTLLAKAVAGEANVPFYAVSGSDFIQVYVGVGASRVRNLFKKAKNHGKAVIFIDEIDAIGKKRSSKGTGGSEEKDQTLNALLTEMSGFNENEGIVVIAATNRLDILDPALLRPGRFDRHIEVTLPDVSAREKIIKLHLKNKPHKDIDITDLALKTSYFSGAKLENLINEAAILACKEDIGYINNKHIDNAFSIVLAGHEKIDKSAIKEEDRKITAYHESGHALISLLKLPEEKVSKITIIPTSNGAGGYTLSLPVDSAYQNLDYLKKKIMVLLGGRAAEEIIFGKEKITTGAYNDLQKTTNMIYNMITEYGMGESLGLLRLSEMPSPLQGSTSKDILKECKSTVDNLYEEAKTLLLKEKPKLEALAKSLLIKEKLSYEEILSVTNLI